MSKSTLQAKSAKPKKPYPDFPLFPHATGRWAKKIRGKTHYFGKWDDPQAALQLYLDQRDDLHAGRIPRVGHEGLTIRELCNCFLTAKRHQLDTGEIVQHTFDDYKKVTDRIVRIFGLTRLVSELTPHEFQALRVDIAKTRGPVALGNEVTRVRVVFNYAFQNHLINAPARYGSLFVRPSKKVLRKERAKNGERMFERHEIRMILDAACSHLRSMILLGINCGYGNSDCGKLPMTAVDLDGDWLSYPRPKTGIDRRCPLWPETISALRASIESRPEPKDDDHAGLVFVTKFGGSWAKAGADNPITKETRKLLDRLGIHRKGLGFYALRHTFRTVADETRDFPAIDLIMGHARDDMASVYRERISDDRLVAVTDHVRNWLFKRSS